jgi:hypothetical protein
LRPDTEQDKPIRRSAEDGAMDDLLNETRMLRRRVNFWQRTAWLLLGAVVVVGSVIWQRGELRRRECGRSLFDLATVAHRHRLESQNRSILEQQWHSTEHAGTKLAPIHYDLIVENWLMKPRAGESLPLAVCREAHFLALSRGRNVLIRDDKGLRVEWRSEEAVAPVVELAARDNVNH